MTHADVTTQCNVCAIPLQRTVRVVVEKQSFLTGGLVEHFWFLVYRNAVSTFEFDLVKF